MADQNKNHIDSSEIDEQAKRSKDMPVKSKEDMQQRLGLGLKNMYLSVLDEPLPGDMLALLDQLDDDDRDDDRNEAPGRPDADE